MIANPYTIAAAHFVDALVGERWAQAARGVAPSVPPEAMGADALATMWAQLTGQLGPLDAVEPLESAERDGRQVVDLAARFARSEVTLRVVLDDEARVCGFWVSPPRPPAYDAPSYVDRGAFDEVELTLGREPALPAVLTRPRGGIGGGGAVPVAVLVHGSGPNDRDETVGANRPFRDLAWGLASMGVAVLRYDKRTFAHPQSMPAGATVEEEVIADAVDALAAARAGLGSHDARVFLVGHSLGGTLAPEIAQRDGGVAGVVLLAASARPLGEVLTEQVGYVAGLPDADPRLTEELRQLRDVAAQLAARALPPEANVLGVTAHYFYDLDERRPLDRVRALQAPVLAVHGGRDYQVTGTDLALWRTALADRAEAEVREYPQLNHLFIAGRGMATPREYRTSAGHVHETLVRDLAAWIHARS